jgi:hypothetical protein
MTQYCERMQLNPPASERDIKQIPSIAFLPPDYADFLRLSDGAEGFVGDWYLAVYKAAEVSAFHILGETEKWAPGLVIFGSDGGGEYYCFDHRGPRTTVGIVDMVCLGIDEPHRLADSFTEFLKYLHENKTGSLKPKL